MVQMMLTRDLIGYAFYLPVFELLRPRCAFAGSDVAATLLAGGLTGPYSLPSLPLRSDCVGGLVKGD